MPDQNLLIIILGAAILIWQIILTILFVRVLNRYKKLIKLEREDLERKVVRDISQRISILEKKELEHIQKVNLLRFNPFNETGGDNSFTLCFLDAKLNGIVLTGLHTREKTRMYAKEIKNGKSSKELSSEEKKVIEEISK